MDQHRPFLYLTLFFLGFLIWTTWQQEHAPKPVVKKGIETSQTTAEVPSSVPAAVPTNTNIELPKANNTQVAGNTNRFISVKTDVLDLLIDLQGGTIKQVDLPTYPVSLEEKDNPVRILDTEKGYSAQSGLIHRSGNGIVSSEIAPNHYAKFQVQQDNFVLTEGDSQLVVPLVWTNNQGITVTKRYIFERGKFLIQVEQQIDNQTSTPWVGNEYLQFTHKGETKSNGFLMGVQAYTGAAYYNNKYSKVKFGDIEDGELKPKSLDQMTDEEKENRLVQDGWVAMLEHFFVSAWVPQKDNINTYYTNYIKDKPSHIIGVKSPEKMVNSGSTGIFKSQLYIGPAIQSELEKVSKGLELTVDYGIFTFVSKPIFAVMNFIHSYVGNWGWSIILLTLLIKIIFFYPSAISYRSMAKMKKMAPKIKEINEKYKHDPQTKQKETFAFYKKEKINPLGGCLPMLIQLPVFMGLYWVLLESVELRQAPWILWYKDLSIMDPYFVLPLIMGASMWFQQKLNPPMMQDPMQQKIFTYLPVVFTVMFLFFPAGLVLYWVVNNLLSIFQQWYITKKIIDS